MLSLINRIGKKSGIEILARNLRQCNKLRAKRSAALVFRITSSTHFSCTFLKCSVRFGFNPSRSSINCAEKTSLDPKVRYSIIPVLSSIS